ncbi:TPA: DEAD/DEAH box helicase family protein [Bacillus cereus]|uniref:Type III restriction enzyme, res subunit family n=1 Tax=Bacillus cereus (strain B4264) TaxID=405532 RepID=B7HFR1_BACC4|nr:DEAD/DEAH box helicase family protein [Bacillus cereus]ACK60199.1 type III restriction enzyme, res subunit family [Bacillus cereus B4264]PGX26501.1 restriction endonuclease [Bacillus cereus]
MESKIFQKKVIGQLERFLELLNETNDIQLAYNRFWNEQNVPVGQEGVPPYKNSIKNTPNICFKVPTGGGKTFLACSSIKPIFDSMPFTKTKAVVWLVPSNAILEQTIKNLKDTSHPYRQKIDTDFSGRVEVYTKDQLLHGQNFNPTSVNEQLSIFILSFDTLRSRKKEDRKIYQENGSLSQFTKFYNSPETLIDGIDDTALIQVINQLSPVVIVDESHNATTDLSIEMLVNLNPSFVLDLTATPKENSNIISYVDAIELKKENMVKLPVIVYNRQNQRDVLLDAIDLRNKLEIQAKNEEAETGRYIRPIALFQAQPKGKESSETFEKLKEDLINIGIPQEHIAIKTSEINELKEIDLLSSECPVRYIITVNALKEGWDCPFAYVLATLANKSSSVDVEQILGRILRQPFTKRNVNPFLNMSYVLTSSSDFRDTLDNIVIGLNKAGFSKNDYRIANEIEIEHEEPRDEQTKLITNTLNQQNQIFETSTILDEKEKNSEEPIEEFLDFDFNEVKTLLEERKPKGDTLLGDEIDSMFASAISKNEEYSRTVEEFLSNDDNTQSMEIRGKMKNYKMNEEYKNEVESIKIPQFFIQSEPSLFISEGLTLLTKERLAEGFSLKDKDTTIDFETLDNNLVKVDIEGSGESVPKYSKLSKADTFYFKEYFSKLPLESKIKNCKEIIYKQLNKIDTVDARDLRAYIDRVVENMTRDQIENLENYVHSYADKIKKKIIGLQEDYLEEQFDKLVEQEIIKCQDHYKFSKSISPLKTIKSLPRSLYQEEGNINNFEYKVINEIISLGNIKWWHKNIDRRGFNLNGFLNHYPDFIVMTNSGKLIMIETKGDHLENTDSRRKSKLGRTWQHQVGNKYRYYMVFENKNLNIEGAFQFEKFIDIFKKL